MIFMFVNCDNVGIFRKYLQSTQTNQILHGRVKEGSYHTERYHKYAIADGKDTEY